MDEAEKMTILVVEPEEAPYVRQIGTGLEELQKAVGGYIEAVYPYEEPVALIVNEEGKLDGLPLNRALRDEEGNIYDIVAGTMLVVGLGEEDFCSLTPEQIQRFTEEFRIPEQFVSIGGQIVALPMEQKKEADRSKIPVYRYPADYASEHGQMKAYRASLKCNTACRDAIEAAIRDSYRENRLDPTGARKVMEEYGAERVQYVLAVTIHSQDWDGRYSPENKAWAKEQAIHENKDHWGQDRNIEFVVSQSHPGLVNLFTSQIRKLEQEKGRPSVRDKLQKAQATPSPRLKKKRVPER